MDKEYLEKLLLDEGLTPVAGRAGAAGGSSRGASLSRNAANPDLKKYHVLVRLRSQEARYRAPAHI